MNEYLINSGDFEIIVRPEVKAYYILDEMGDAAEVVSKFIQGEPIAYDNYQSYWFKYEVDENWEDLDKKYYSLVENISETELLDHFLLKKYNVASLLAFRNTESTKVKVHKKDKVEALIAN